MVGIWRSESVSAVRQTPTAGVIGDSIMSRGYTSSASTGLRNSEGTAEVINYFLGNRFNIVSNTAVSGATSADIVSQASALATAAVKPRYVFMNGGTNDTGTNAATIANIASIYAIFKAAQIQVIDVGCFPRNSGGQTKAILLMERNRYSAKYAQNNPGVWFIDSYHQLLDVSTVAQSVAGAMLSANTADGLHPNAVGSRVVGIHAASILDSLVLSDVRRSIGGSDGTNGDLNNACLNALMLGSGGSAGTGASGTIPQYWGAARNAGTGITGVISQVARTNGRGNWMRATLANAAGAATDTFRFTRQYSVGSAGTIGDTVFAECDVAYNVTTGTLNKLELVVFAFTSGFATLYTVASNYTDVGASKALALTGTDEITLVTPSFVVPATTAYLFFAFTMGLSVGGDATADIGSAFMGKTDTT